MAKKALVITIEKSGNNGYRVLEVVDANNTFETHSNLQWKDCSDSVDSGTNYWFDPVNNIFKKLPYAVENTLEDLPVDAEGNPIEEYIFDYDNEVWTKVQIINQ